MRTSNKKTQIIFLDCDGVLTSERCNGYYDFDLWAVNYLRWVCAKTGAKIVMSSAWRKREKAEEWFTEVFGKHLHMHWRTGVSETRGHEINEWMDEHPEIENFVILDDDLHGLENHREWLVLTSIEDGMLTKHMKAVNKKLGLYGGHLPRLTPIDRSDVYFYVEREGVKRLTDEEWLENVRARNERKENILTSDI